jgi:serine/threonine protein kinase
LSQGELTNDRLRMRLQPGSLGSSERNLKDQLHENDTDRERQKLFNLWFQARYIVEKFTAPRCSKVTEALLVALYDCPPSAAALALWCLQWNPQERPSAEEALRHSFFAEN